MEDDVIEKYREAGRIAREARLIGKKRVEPGVSARAVVDAVESFIREEGAAPAFPVNVAVDDVAAHYTPGVSDDVEFAVGQVVNIDVGVQVDGYIGDTATTVDLSGDQTDLLAASRDAVDAALELVEPGCPVADIGAAVQSVIEDYGFKPIRNLSGHSLEQYVQHAGQHIPNVETTSKDVLQAGEAIAIEPFATDGAGEVRDGKPGNIYRLQNDRVRGRTERKVIGEIKNTFRTLPFAARWVSSIPPARVPSTLSRLVRSGNLHAYDVLVEADAGLVSQHEHTVLVLDDPIVTTR